MNELNRLWREGVENKEKKNNLNLMLSDIQKLHKVNGEIIDDFNDVANQFSIEVPDNLPK